MKKKIAKKRKKKRCKINLYVYVCMYVDAWPTYTCHLKIPPRVTKRHPTPVHSVVQQIFAIRVQITRGLYQVRVAYHHHHHHAHTLAHTTPTHASFTDTHLREKHLNHISYAPSVSLFVRQLYHAHVIAPHHLRFLDRILWHIRITNTPYTHLHTTSPSHTHTHISVILHAVDCLAASRPLPPVPVPAPSTCNMCVLCRRFLGFLTHTALQHTCAAHAHLYLLLLCILTLSASTPPLACTPLCSTLSVCLLTFRIIHIDLLKTRRQRKPTVKRK